ncbi:MAG: shikimate dehydrogenase [Candidatus Tectomicrobia bacterium]|nr:shikimate dehydrogenase [Candidatus Tectomicrobia bacterium]
MTHANEFSYTLSGATRLYGIFGHPITHSLSPLMQTFAFQHHHLDCVYVPFPVAPERLSEALPGAIALGIHGLNVTIPHKEAILSLLDAVSAEAQFVGAVNTVVIRDGQTTGYNTDGIGFLQPLTELGMVFADTSVCVLGAGGAARAITMALLQAGCPELTLTNRTPTRAEQLVAALQDRFSQAHLRCVPFAQAADAAHESGLVVNATSVGLSPESADLLPETALRPQQVVYDIVYRPLHTPLLQAAQRHGATIVPGIDMLIGQGAEAFRLWTGLPFPIAELRRLLHPFL